MRTETQRTRIETLLESLAYELIEQGELKVIGYSKENKKELRRYIRNKIRGLSNYELDDLIDIMFKEIRSSKSSLE